MFCSSSNGSNGNISFGYRLESNGAYTERMRITSGGDVQLAGGDIFLNSGTNYNDKGVVYLSNERTAIISDIVNGTANGDTSLDFQTRKSGTRASAMFIDQFRNVGIGTTSPSSYNSRGRNLVVAGAGDVGITIDGASSNSGSIVFADGTGGTAGYRGIIEYYHGDDGMRFFTGASEKMRITSSGITFNGDTAAANALDDYEEGTWTPTNLGTSGFTSSPTVLEGRYTKIGRQVIVSFVLKNYSAGVGLCNIVLGGFPFVQHIASHDETGYCNVYPRGSRRSGLIINNSGGDVNNWWVGFDLTSAASGTDRIRGTVVYTTT
jgi:hypothetical protein